MYYLDVRPARFVSRPNRFVARVEQEGRIFAAHVKNTGRCAELLLPGARVYLEYSRNPARKTPCDLIAVEKERPGLPPLLINMDSAAPNAVAAEWLAAGGLGPLEGLRPEYPLGDSRFDFYAEERGRPVLIEVKGCTLERDGVALFPDAPTLRGLKHVRELTALARRGWRCCVLFVIQMKGPRRFAPNRATQPAFAQALQDAAAAGVEVLARDCLVAPDALRIDGEVEVEL